MKNTFFQTLNFPRQPTAQIFEFQISTSYCNFKIYIRIIVCFDVTLVLVVFILFDKMCVIFNKIKKIKKLKSYYFSNATAQNLKQILRSSLREWKDKSFILKKNINKCFLNIMCSLQNSRKWKRRIRTKMLQRVKRPLNSK